LCGIAPNESAQTTIVEAILIDPHLRIKVSPTAAAPNIATFGYSIHTLQSQMDLSKGFTSGFNYLRFGLSLSVLVWHAFIITSGMAMAQFTASQWAGYITFWILPMFFALSGFLVASSLVRTPSIAKFLWLRFIRIYPALTVEVILSALVLGSLATTLPLKEYFTNPVFFKYLLNTFGWIHYELPGVFADNIFPNILNGSLWTVPFELECYAVLALMALFTLTKRPALFLNLFLFLCIAKVISTFFMASVGSVPANVNGRPLVAFFIAGVFIYLYRRNIPFNRYLALASFVAGCLLMYNYRYVFLASFPVAYFTVWLGLHRPKSIPIVMDGDYSYGIYLYAGPLQQAIWHWTSFGKTFSGNVVLSLILVSIFAAFSWHAIEKPMLRFKKLF
jgi:peptidoglycan/LPS O-acetylase OafA/YrhL